MSKPRQHTRNKSKKKVTNPAQNDSIHISSDHNNEFNKDEIRRMITEEIERMIPTIIGSFRSNMNNDQHKVVDQEKKKICRYKDFLVCKPDTFNGEEGAIGAQRWLDKMEKIINITDCDEKDKVRFAAHSFESEALFWWNMVLETQGKDVVYEMSWKEFKELVMKKYCPYSEARKIEFELMNLKMVGLNFNEYTLKFNELSRLVPHMVTPETEKIFLYIDGLGLEVGDPVRAGNPLTFKSAVDLARKIAYNHMVRDEDDKKRKRDEDNEDYKSGCKICGKMHSGRCRFEGTTCGKCNNIGHTTFNCWNKEVMCYDCGQLDHYRPDCPQRMQMRQVYFTM